jgi:prepilin-type N-terminal cleavage/methylation domain-containing protein
MLKRLRGFTLIELVIVLAILAILAAVAIPKFVDLSKKARKATAESELGSLRSAAQLYYASQAVSGLPGFPANKSVLTGRLDVAVTQICASSPCTTLDKGTSFRWTYGGNAGTEAGRVMKTGQAAASSGWNW